MWISNTAAGAGLLVAYEKDQERESLNGKQKGGKAKGLKTRKNKNRDIEPPLGIPPSLIMARVCNIPDVRAVGSPIKDHIRGA